MTLILTNIKGIHKEIMSNYILGWILSESINTHKYINNQKEKKWERYRSRSIRGKNALIIGYGNIGSAIAKSLSFFGVKSIGVNTSEEVNYIDDSIITIPFTDIYGYLYNIDFIIITAPLTKLNYKFIDDYFFNKLNSFPILINISRAEIVDSSALINAIRNRRVNKAILDVHYSEPLDINSEFWGVENIYITPHISGYFNEGMKMGFLKFKELLIEYLNGETNLSNKVSFTKGY
jgi:phosphoglycerate dehydrogenase-like enzyme